MERNRRGAASVPPLSPLYSAHSPASPAPLLASPRPRLPSQCLLAALRVWPTSCPSYPHWLGARPASPLLWRAVLLSEVVPLSFGAGARSAVAGSALGVWRLSLSPVLLPLERLPLSGVARLVGGVAGSLLGAVLPGPPVGGLSSEVGRVPALGAWAGAGWRGVRAWGVLSLVVCWWVWWCWPPVRSRCGSSAHGVAHPLRAGACRCPLR